MTSELKGEEETTSEKRLALNGVPGSAGCGGWVFGSAYPLTIVLLGKVCPLYIIEGLPMKVAQSGHWGVAFH